MADRVQSYRLLSWVVLLAGVGVGLTAFGKEWFLSVVLQLGGDQVKITSLVAIVILFGPASVALGVVSPYATRLKLTKVNESGKTVGNLYALSTLGSIVGTFAAGFWLIPSVGNTALLYLTSFCLVGTSILLHPKSLTAKIFLVMLMMMYYLNQAGGFLKIKVLKDIDSQYGRIIVKKERLESGR